MDTQSDDKDEIFCSSCGRPNLPEAVKCWYCQSPLSQESPEAEGQNNKDAHPEQAPAAQAVQPAPTHDPTEEVPEWLRRIREKEQKDREAQEARDQWQQQALFGSSVPAEPPAHPRKKEPARPVPHKAADSAHKEKEVKKADTPPVLAPVPPSQPPVKKSVVNEEETQEEDLGDADKDLPDGFIKFDSKSR